MGLAMPKVAMVITFENTPQVVLYGVPILEASAAVARIGRRLMLPRFLRGSAVVSGLSFDMDADGVTTSPLSVMTLDLRRVIAVNLAKSS